MSTIHGPGRHTDRSFGQYCVRVLGGRLQLEFPGRTIDAPRAPTLVGPLILLALNPRRELAIETFKVLLYDTDPALVSTATIQTPISRLRSAGLPIPPRVYLLDVAPSDVDIVDFDHRAKEFIDRAVNPDRLSDDEVQQLEEQGFELHHLWQHDPGDAVANQTRLSALFEPHRRRNRRFGSVFVRLLMAAGERERAEDILDQYVDRYGTDEIFEDLEAKLRTPARSVDSRGSVGTGLANEGVTLLGGPMAEGAALAELRDRLAATVGFPFAELGLGANNLDRIHSIDRVAIDHEARISGVPVEAAGGAAANTAVGLARLGHRVAVAGMVADDRYGSLLRQSFAQERVDCTNLVVVPGRANARTGHTLIFTDPFGGRSAFVEAGVNDHFAEHLRDAKEARERLSDTARRSRVVNFSSFTGDPERRLQEDLLAELPEEVVVGFDPGAFYAHLGLDRLAPFVLRCDVLYVYEGRLQQLLANSSAEMGSSTSYSFRATVEALFRWRASRVDRPLVLGVKRARQPGGAVSESYDMITIAVGRNSIEDLISAHARGSSEAVVADITGQGDAIAAAVHMGLLSGAPLGECADLAYVLANETNAEIGPRNGLPRRSTVVSVWTKHFPGTELPVWVPRD